MVTGSGAAVTQLAPPEVVRNETTRLPATPALDWQTATEGQAKPLVEATVFGRTWSTHLAPPSVVRMANGPTKASQTVRDGQAMADTLPREATAVPDSLGKIQVWPPFTV